MIKLTNKDVKRIIVSIAIIIVVFAILELYNINYYKIDVNLLSEKGLLYYKNLKTVNSYVTSDFMKYISDEEYEKAFQLLDKNNKKSMFNDSIQQFKNELNAFSDSYTELQYNTIFSREFDKYVDEEIVCMICNSDNEVEHSIRFNIRTYKSNKDPKVVILNIN